MLYGVLYKFLLPVATYIHDTIYLERCFQHIKHYHNRITGLKILIEHIVFYKNKTILFNYYLVMFYDVFYIIFVARRNARA